MPASEILSDVRALTRYNGFTKLASARFISNLGNGITPIALSFGVLGLPNGTASQLSVVLGSQMIPLLLFMLFGGVVGDRYKRNKIVGGSDILGSAFVMVSATSFIFGFVSIPLLCVMGALFGILNALWWPAFSGVLPGMVFDFGCFDGRNDCYWTCLTPLHFIWIPIVISFFAGVAIEIFYVAWSTSMQHNIPEESYSRVVSYDALGSYALAPIGLIFIGPLAEQIGTKNALFILAALVFAATVSALSVREVRMVRNKT